MNIRRWWMLGLLVLIFVGGRLITDAGQASQTPEKLNVNFASLEDVSKLPGISAELARKIIEKRPYRKIDDLLEVNGMTQEILANIEAAIVIKKLNINTAVIDELTVLSEIDKKLAEAIINERPFVNLEELLKIQGISEKSLKTMQELIEIGPPEDPEEKRGWKMRRKNYPNPPDASATTP